MNKREVDKHFWYSYLDGDHIIPDRYYQCPACAKSGFNHPYRFCPNCGIEKKEVKPGWVYWYE